MGGSYNFVEDGNCMVSRILTRTKFLSGSPVWVVQHYPKISTCASFHSYIHC